MRSVILGVLPFALCSTVSVVIGMAALGVAPAHADSITYNSGSLFIMAAPSGAAPSGTVAATLPQFDPTLGQLTSADFSIDWFLGVISDAYTFDPFGQGSVTATITDHFTLTSPDATVLVDASTTTMQTVDFVGFANLIYVLTGGGGVGSLLATDAATPQFVGAGNITLPLNFDVATTYDFTNGSGTGFVALDGSADASVTYNFSPTSVPEPGSIALLATFALSGAGFLARRRKNAHQAV